MNGIIQHPSKRDMAALKKCSQNYGQMYYKHVYGHITDEEWQKWFDNHCGQCCHFKGACYK